MNSIDDLQDYKENLIDTFVEIYKNCDPDRVNIPIRTPVYGEFYKDRIK